MGDGQLDVNSADLMAKFQLCAPCVLLVPAPVLQRVQHPHGPQLTSPGQLQSSSEMTEIKFQLLQSFEMSASPKKWADPRRESAAGLSWCTPRAPGRTSSVGQGLLRAVLQLGAKSPEGQGFLGVLW